MLSKTRTTIWGIKEKMRQRIITGTFLLAVLAILIYFGEGNLEYLFSGFCVILAGLAAYEFTNMSRNNQKKRWFDYISVLTTVAFATMSVIYFDTNIFYMYVFIFIIGLLLFYTILFIFIKEFNRADFGNQLLTVFYTSLGFIAFAYLRKVDIYLNEQLIFQMLQNVQLNLNYMKVILSHL